MILTLLHLIALPLVWIVDTINDIFLPWQPFTRPVSPKYPETLAVKADKFEKDLIQGFSGAWWYYKLPHDSGDQALWHGVATFMWAMKYTVTKTYVDLLQLKGCISGLEKHQLQGIESSPRLVRGFRDDGTFEDSVSKDQASGHILGIYALWRWGDDECKARALRLACGIADELLAHNYCLVGADGLPTPFGVLVNGYLTEPLSLSVALVILKVASEITGDARYTDPYNMLARKYKFILPYAKSRLLWWEKTPDTHRVAINYSILMDLEKDPALLSKYSAGLARTWRMDEKSGNPWIYFLYVRHFVGKEGLDNALKHLLEFTLENKQWTDERINSKDYDCVNWGGTLRARQPIPQWKMGSQDFFWQRHMYSVDDWIGGDLRFRHNGLDFLVCYWGFRHLNLIGDSQ